MPNYEVDFVEDVSVNQDPEAGVNKFRLLFLYGLPKVLDDLADLTLSKSPGHAAFLSVLATVSREIGSWHNKLLRKSNEPEQ